MADAGVTRVGIGKVDDLFAGRNISSEPYADERAMRTG